MAEAFYNNKLNGAISAGLSVYEPSLASENAIITMEKFGIDIRKHRSKQLTYKMTEESDLILTMTERQKDFILSVDETISKKTFTLCEYTGFDKDIQDPFGMGLDEYFKCAENIKKCVDKLTHISVRKTIPQDIEEIIDVERKTKAVTWNETMLKEELKNPDSYYFSAEHLGKVIGYGGFKMIFDEIHIMTVSVLEDYRRCGIGTRIMNAVENSARELNAKKIFLDVRESNTCAKMLYDKLGFSTCGVRKKYYSDNNENAIVMTKDIG